MRCKPPRLIVFFVCVVVLGLLLAACAPAAPPTPTSVPKPAPPAAAPTAPVAKPAPPTAAPKPAAPTAAPKPAATVAPAAGPAEWVVALAEEAPTLDPAWVSTGTARQIWMHFFDPLLSVEGMDFKMVPALAESWRRTDDRTWEFKIRKGVKFHNGDELTANDVKYSFDIYKSEKSRSQSYLAEVASVDVIDQYTAKLTTRAPSPVILQNIRVLPIMPRDAREKAGEEAFGKKPIGTGPYKVVDFALGQRLVLEANPNYWRGPVTPKKLTLRLVRDPSTRVAELKSGGVQIIQAPPPAEFKALDTGDNQLVPLKDARLMLHPFNTSKKPFDDVRVRQAINYAIDRDAIIKNVLEGYGVPMRGPFVPGWMGYDPNLKPYPYDPNKAKQLLAEAGYPNGLKAVWDINVGVFLKDREIAEVVASQVAKAGIDLQIVPTERAKLASDYLNGTFQGISSLQWGTSSDSDGMIGYLFYKRKAHTPDDKLTTLIEQSRRTVDPDQRTKVLQDLGRYVHDQAYLLFIHAQYDVYAKRKNVPWEPYPILGEYATLAFYQVPGR